MCLIGAGFTLTPWKLVGAESSIQRFRLPPASVHIPHGNFASEEVQKLYISEMNVSISSQIFMKNGIESSENDLSIYTIKSGNEVVIITPTDEYSSTAGDIQNLSVRISKTMVILNSPLHRLHIDVKSNCATLFQL